ncbi:MAG: type I secretion system permease/ATPase [Boseongicola sp.]
MIEFPGLRGLVFSAFIFSIFTNLLMLTGPLFMLQVYDRVLGSRSEETLVALFSLVALLYFLFWLLEYARGRVMARAGARLQSYLNEPVFSSVLQRAALRRGAQSGSLQDLDAVRGLLSSPVTLALFDVPWTPLFLAAIFIFHPLLGWLALIGGAILVAIAILNQALTSKKTSESLRLSAVAHRFSQQAEEGGELIWAQGMARAASIRWVNAQDKAVELSLRVNDWTRSFGSFTKAFRLFLQSAVLAVGAWLVLQTEITAGAMIAASILLGRALAPVEQSISQWQIVQRGRTGWAGIQDLIAELDDREVRTELPPPRASLDIVSLSVGARPGEPPILKQVSIDLNPGEAVGVIGRSGSGKTTLARAIVGLISPTGGEIRLAGATLDQYDRAQLGHHIGYLPQDIQLFDGTVSENIAQLDRDPDANRVVNAAKKAQLHDTILRLPDGYDTVIGGSIVLLSGGQKQRLALARALYNDPVLLVLDEPNSALDNEGSQALTAVVLAMKAEGKGVLIMTHRPTAISACDRLVVLEGGKVAAYGPRDDIIRSFMKNAGDIQRIIKSGSVA